MSTRKRLIALGPERLADALIEIAERDDEAARVVDRLAATSEENVLRFEQALRSLRRGNRFVGYHEAAAFAAELGAMLADLAAGDPDPREGVKAIAAFFRCDEAVLGRSDDSDGHLGDVFRFDARDAFVDYASRCDDKAWLAEVVFDLTGEDDYGVRDAVVASAAEYLPEDTLRHLAGRFWEAAREEEPAEGTEAWMPNGRLLLLESLARQLRDPRMYERARRALSPQLGTAACAAIAEAYHESGDADTALTWLERIPAGEHFMATERERLLLEIHRALGHGEEVTELLWGRFRARRSLDRLEALLDVIGAERRDEIVQEAAVGILAEEGFDPGDAGFLLDCGLLEEAGRYVLERRDRLNGALYFILLPLAEGLEGERPLAAVVIYRALLESILDRAQSRYYHHGVRYLQRLDSMAEGIAEWGDVEWHEAYVARLREAHRRKRSFWARYR